MAILSETKTLHSRCLDDSPVKVKMSQQTNSTKEQAFLATLASLSQKVNNIITTTTTKKPNLPNLAPSPSQNGAKCGMSSDEAPHPWQAQIKVLKDGSSVHMCSGVILTEKHVLTSASCLVNNPMKHYIIVVGQRDLDILDDWEEEFSIQSVYTHDDFNEDTGDHDIAIVKLKQRRGQYINLASHHIQPICLPPSGKCTQRGKLTIFLPLKSYM